MSTALYCLNVGQANCLVVLVPSQSGKPGDRAAIVIDVGVDGAELAKWLTSVGVRHLPLVLLTHNDRDHILGLDALVEGFRKRVGTVGFVVDRDPADIPFWLPVQEWSRDKVVQRVEEVRAQAGAAEPCGRLLHSDETGGYWLYCVYPTVFENQAAVSGAKTVGPKPRKGHNATSAVFGLATSQRPRKWRVVFGGDLDLPGWHSLSNSGRLLVADVFVVPHHGGPRHETKGFGFAELADAVSPAHALISVGTDQSFGHPLPELVKALRDVDATVMCTQITSQCVKKPDALPNRTVLPLAQLTDPTHLAPSGTACAGTVAVVVSTTRPPTVLRVEAHQAAVDGLATAKNRPLCRR
jgi:competence protein ComEC